MNAPVKSTPSFGEATRHFREAGIPEKALIPIAPLDAKISDKGGLRADNLGKAPGKYLPHKREWCGLKGSHLTDGIPAEEWERMAEWLTPNVGLSCRFFPAIDSDVESKEGAKAVERAFLRTFGKDARYVAERGRTGSPRCLYAFASRNPDDPDARVRYRKFQFRLPSDPENAKPHGVDILGYGRQFVAKGIHRSGGMYEWNRDFDLCELVQDDQLLTADDADMDRFLENLAEEVEAIGGTVLHSGSGGGGGGKARDYSADEPAMAVEAVFRGLELIPNTAEDFETRDKFVSILAKVRAALGCEAEPNRDRVKAWACADPVFCPPEYFDDVWDSLDQGVRQASQDGLELFFRDHSVVCDFPALTQAEKDVPEENKAVRKEARVPARDAVAGQYVFARVNTDTDDGSLRMRDVLDPSVEFPALNWWLLRSDDPNTQLVRDLHNSYGEKDDNFWTFIRDMRRYHPDRFFTGKTRNPLYDRGEIVCEKDGGGVMVRELNMRFISPVIRHAKLSKLDPEQAREDVARILDFIERIFLDQKLVKYELDTLAFMAQKGRRPGHMLLLVGDSGVGKSTYIQMLISMFDGTGKGMGSQIDGTKITNEAARRFALANVEGCRIISIKELPEGSTASNMAAVTSSIKQMVDPGTDGDYIEIERKRKDVVSVRNFARVVSTSNYANALKIEKHDRRIFFVMCGITIDTKPNRDWYADVNDVTGSPKRLAAFWRYLLARDVSHYDPAQAPPVTREKAEAQILGLPAWERHYEAAIETLRAGKRSLFDLGELGELMTAMGENEYTQTDGDVDDRRQYDFGRDGSGGGAANTAKRLERYAVKLLRPKVNGERLPPVYGLRTARPLIDKLAGADRDDILEALDRDRAGCTLPRVHPVSDRFNGPLKPASGRRQ